MSKRGRCQFYFCHLLRYYQEPKVAEFEAHSFSLRLLLEASWYVCRQFLMSMLGTYAKYQRYFDVLVTVR